MSNLQQALVHLALVVVAVTAVVVLAVTGNLSTLTGGLVLAITGFGSVAVAGTTPTAAVPVASVAVPTSAGQLSSLAPSPVTPPG